MDLTINVRMKSDVVILDMSGRLWILDLPLLDLTRKLMDDGHRNLVINLTDLSYMDSSGLGQMIAIWTSIRSRDGHMTVLRPSERIQKLLQMTKLSSIFEIFENENEAIAAASTRTDSLPQAVFH